MNKTNCACWQEPTDVTIFFQRILKIREDIDAGFCVEEDMTLHGNESSIYKLVNDQ